MSQLLLSAKGLSVRLSGRPVLRGVDLHLSEGEALAIIGPNGAGKSTLLKALMGLVPFTGQVTALGRPLDQMKQRQIGQLMALVPQPSEGRPPVTPRELAELSRYPWHGPFEPLGKEDESMVRSALGSVGLMEQADLPMEDLSGGEAQRALVASALAQGTRIILLDEPTAFLDHLHQEEMLKLLLSLKGEGELNRKGMIMVTHDLNLAMAWADRVLALSEGQALFEMRPSKIGPEHLERLFKVPFARLTDHRGRSCLVPEVLLR